MKRESQANSDVEQLCGRPEHFASLARLRLGQGQPVAALRALRLALEVSRSGSGRRNVRAVVVGLERLIEEEVVFEAVCVGAEEYERVFDQFAVQNGPVPLPRRMCERVIVLHNLLVFFEPSSIYTVEEVRQTLREAIEAFSMALTVEGLCRSMVSMRMFRRTVDGQLWWVNPLPPLELQEAAAA